MFESVNDSGKDNIIRQTIPILTPNLKLPWAVSYSNTSFGGASAKIYTCFERKTASVMQNFQNLWVNSG